MAGIAAAKLAKSMVVKDKSSMERLTTKSSKVSNLKIAGATAAFVTGLYVNRIDQFTIVDADAADLRDTAGFERCLADTYKNPGS